MRAIPYIFDESPGSPVRRLAQSTWRLQREHFRRAERGPRSIQWSERVDGSAPPEALNDAQLRSWRWLDKCHRRLGTDGSMLVHDVLVRNMSMRHRLRNRGAWRGRDTRAISG